MSFNTESYTTYTSVFQQTVAGKLTSPPCLLIQLQNMHLCVSTNSDRLTNWKEGNVLFNDALNILFTVLWRQTWLRTILIVRKETRCRHIGYSFRLTAMVLSYALSHRQDSTYHGLCYTSHGALAGTRNSSMGSP